MASGDVIIHGVHYFHHQDNINKNHVDPCRTHRWLVVMLSYMVHIISIIMIKININEPSGNAGHITGDTDRREFPHKISRKLSLRHLGIDYDHDHGVDNRISF